MDIPDKSSFQPSKPTLNQWLATRKRWHTVGGAAMPGFFTDTGNVDDTTWFWLAFIGELAGLFTTIYGGFRSGGIFLLLATLTIVLFIICDYVFAAKLHRNKAHYCKKLAQKYLLEDSAAAERQGIDNELEEGRMTDFLLMAGILLIALIKLVGIVLLGVFNNLILYIPFAVIYFIVAYVHITHTGYYFAYVTTEKRIRREHRQFGKTSVPGSASGAVHKAQTPSQSVLTPLALQDVPLQHLPHKVVKERECSQCKRLYEGVPCPDHPNAQPVDRAGYAIKTQGVLTDDDIILLIAGQTDENKLALFKAARKLQVELV